MRRREFITLLGGAAAVWPLVARAQQTDRVRQIGVLASGTEQDPMVQARLAVFRQGLEKLGWMEHRNVRVDYRFAQASRERGQVLAKELVALRPDVIFAQTTPMVAALQRESRDVPIVFVEVSDPINSGFTASLARPGGNLTGLLLYEEGITGKWLAMLKEIAPHLARAALLANPKTTPYEYFLRAANAVVPSLAIELVPSPVASAADIERTIESFARMPNGGLVLPPEFHHLFPSRSHHQACSTAPVTVGALGASLGRGRCSCPTASTASMRSGRRHPLLTVSCAALIPETCRCRHPQSTRR